MPRRQPDDAHGVSQREAQVLDRADAGEATGAIAAALGVAESYVDWVVQTFPLDTLYEARWRAAAIVASERYVAAVAACSGAFR